MLAAPVQLLISHSIHSAAALELLLLLYRSPETYWSPTAAAAALGADEGRMRQSMELLARHDLLVPAREIVAYRYAPKRAADAAVVDQLVAAYDQQRVAVLDAVHAAGNASLDAFADAFRLRRA